MSEGKDAEAYLLRDRSAGSTQSPVDAGGPLNSRKELMREQIMDAAVKLFVMRGYVQTSISDIAGALGLGRSAVYHYFGNKEDILLSLVESETMAPWGLLEELNRDRNLTASERLRRAIADGIVRRLSSGSRFLFFSRLEAQIPPHLSGRYNQTRRWIYDFYVRCISDGIANGEFRDVDPKITAFSVIGMANWTTRWYSAGGQKTPREIAEVVADIAMQGLCRSGIGGNVEAVNSTIAAMRKEIASLEKVLP